ncbi:Protein of unknown function DUF1647 domain containing protein [Aphelenchoides besseyi]|nr:Protein of unknown function DUF1647 domain containing protein [Aphelenchoides besseyi]
MPELPTESMRFFRINLLRFAMLISLIFNIILLFDYMRRMFGKSNNNLLSYKEPNSKLRVARPLNPQIERNMKKLVQDGKLVLCNCNGENFCFKGLDEVGNVRLGFPFNCSLYEQLKSLQLLDSDAANAKPDYKQIEADDNWSPVFVTSVSTTHFRELRNFVKTIRTHYPKSKIVIFDIGLQAKEIEELKSWCLVEYRRFDFSKYPPHVKKIMNYSFKLAIIEAFQTYKTFFYLDTSVRIKSKNLAAFLQGVQSGVLLPFSTHMVAIHSVYATTHPNMSTYLPLPLIITQMHEIQSPSFLSDSPYTRYILKWLAQVWYLCATTKDCIDPLGADVRCAVEKYPDLYRTYINCHRFDQAYWNIAGLAYLFGPERGAVQLNYTKNWDTLTENLIVEVEQKREKAMQKFSNLISIHRYMWFPSIFNGHFCLLFVQNKSIPRGRKEIFFVESGGCALMMGFEEQ